MFRIRNVREISYIALLNPAGRMTCALGEARRANREVAASCPATPIAQSRLCLEPPPELGVNLV